MENKDAIRDTRTNQNMILTILFTLTGGGIVLIFNLIYDMKLTYSLILVGLTLFSWLTSLISGLIFLVKRGDNSAKASYGEDIPVPEEYWTAPKFIRGQRYFFLIGVAFIVLWLIWHLLSNTYTRFPK